MPTATARSTAGLLSADDCETALHAQAPNVVEKDFHPLNGPLALDERTARVVDVATVSALLSRIPVSIQLDFGDYLRELCDGLAETFGRSDPKLTCAAAEAALPIGAAITLGLIADLLITNAFDHAFPPERGGRIAVSFIAGEQAWQLTVEDSGITMQGHGERRDHGVTIARLLVLRLGGRLKIPTVHGGTRCIVILPRPAGLANSAVEAALQAHTNAGSAARRSRRLELPGRGTPSQPERRSVGLPGPPGVSEAQERTARQ